MERTTTAKIEEVCDIIAQGERFLLALHAAPDGDSVGSSLAMAQALASMNKTAHVSGPDPIPEHLAFIPGSSHWRPASELQPPYDAYIFVDCADLDRIGPIADVLAPGATVVNIDHHGTNSQYGTINIIEPMAPAAAVIVERLIRRLNVRLDAAMATGLYTALMTDTGSFQYQNTTADTLRLAARLVDAGAAPAEIAASVYASRRLPELRLLAAALDSLTLGAGNQLASMRLSLADFDRAGAERSHTDGIVNYARSIQGVEVGLLFIEEAEAQIKVSLRSSAWLDVAALAERFGGGGHARAAGLSLELPLAVAEERVVEAVEEALSAADGGSGVDDRG